MRRKYNLEERKQHYIKTRERIFGSANELKRTISKKILKLRTKFCRKEKTRKLVIESIRKADNGKDPRAYADIVIGNYHIKGLLDTGASINLLGKNCRELVDKIGGYISPIYSLVSTADGKSHRLLGKLELEIRFNDKINKILFYLCPDLEQEAYLGVDFWKKFNLAPEVFEVDEIDVEKIQNEFKANEYKTDPHVLNESQKGSYRKLLRNFLHLRN